MYLKITTPVTALVTTLERYLDKLYRSSIILYLYRNYLSIYPNSIDYLIKIRYLVLIILIEVNEVYNTFY